MLALAVFVTWSVNFLDIDLERLPGVLGRLADVLARRYYPPDLDHIWHRNYLAAVGEALQMSYAAAVVGMLIAAPLAWCASFKFPRTGFCSIRRPDSSGSAVKRGVVSHRALARTESRTPNKQPGPAGHGDEFQTQDHWRPNTWPSSRSRFRSCCTKAALS
jgi:hypothetical protein